MPLVVLKGQRKPTNHFDDLYFYMTKTEGYFEKEMRKNEQFCKLIEIITHYQAAPKSSVLTILEPNLIAQTLNHLVRYVRVLISIV